MRKVRCLVVTGGENERMIGTLSLVIVPPETIYIYKTAYLTGTDNILFKDWGMSSIAFVHIWKYQRQKTLLSVKQDSI